ncbi:MAG: hypothetical protein K8R02_07980 [Anaerohalosphaeraceae bacterium]|nr:hypothetical protein [Anaerohalosphaeraceae bacterium]
MENRKFNFLLTVVVLSAVAACLGCAVGVIATPRESEGSKPAEFMLADTDGDIVVYVRQPAWLRTPVDTRLSMTKAVNASLIAKAKVKRQRITTYAEIVKKRRLLPVAEAQDPLKFALAIEAEYLLVIDIDDFALSTFAEKDFYTGAMQVSARLFDRAGTKLWPESEDSRKAVVRIESEKGTVKSSVDQLSAAAAHCITRYLYDCNNRRFKIPHEQRKETYVW